MRFNLQTKLFLLLIGLTSVILASVLVSINATLTETIEKKIIGDFSQTQSFFQSVQKLRYDRLIESASLIGENSTFKANVALRDPASVYFSVTEFSKFASVDLFIVTDHTGKVLARLGDRKHNGDYLSDRESISRALNGTPYDYSLELPELWAIDEHIYQIVSVPIYTNEQTIIGTLTLGTRFTKVEAEEYKGSSNVDITLYLGNSVIATTVDSVQFLGVSAFCFEHKKEIDTVQASFMPTAPFETELGGEEIFAFVSPLGIGEPAYYLASVQKSRELKILQSLQRNIFITGSVSFIVTLFISIVIGRLFSRPVRRLTNAMSKVKEGNLDITVTPSTTDEIGTLANAFNEMIVGLRERFQLTKYVGSYTMEMVRKTSGGTVSLGGARQELAVLFSDIRGFTSFSEHRSPEEVIDVLNRYLSIQSDIVATMNGSVDKFVGDEMVALFSGENALQHAIHSAILIQQRIHNENKKSGSTINIGIGINYGSMLVGNMGAINRMDYTAIGSEMNLAARLCSSAVAGQILIPKHLLAQFNGRFTAGDSARMHFKGFSGQIEVTEIRYENN